MDHRLACDTQAPLFWESEPPLTFAHMPLPKSSSARLSPSIWLSILVNAKLRAGYNNPDLPKVFLMPVTKKRPFPLLAAERMHPGRALFCGHAQRPSGTPPTVSRGSPQSSIRGGASGIYFFRNFRNIAFRRTQISFIFPAVPSHLRGGSRSSRTRGGMRWTRMALLTRALSCGRRSRVVLTPRRWRQVRRRRLRLMTVTNKPGHRGEHEGNR
jgi:hypothetical protein